MSPGRAAAVAATWGRGVAERRAAPTCWVLEHGLGVGVRVDEAPQQDGHVGHFVLGQLLQSGLRELQNTGLVAFYIHLQQFKSNAQRNSERLQPLLATLRENCANLPL